MPAETPPLIPAVPRATARLQFAAGFGFAQARELVPYLARLGISHLYASPFLKARPGSTHGYDITDHAQLNPELGSAADFDALVAALHAQGMGLILDFVPNHMGVGGSDNPWWLDVLEWGQASLYAPFFDIDWEAHADGRLLLPVLGDQYGTILEKGELTLVFEGGGFSVVYYAHRCPIAVRDYPRLLREAWERLEDGAAREPLSDLANGFAGLGTPPKGMQKLAGLRRQVDELKSRLAALVEQDAKIAAAITAVLDRVNGRPDDPASFRDLHALLERQSYRMAFWRVASDEINYRRFFDVNELAGLRMERPDLFELAHPLVFRLISDGKLQGLRIDHIDGLYDPKAYAEQVQTRAAYLTDRPGELPVEAGGPRLRDPLYVVVEKILARHEKLREDWPVAGTTGYEFMVMVGGLFVDPAAEAALTETYERFLERAAPYEEMLLEAKRLILGRNLSAELNVLARELHGLAQQSWSTRDHTRTGIRRALADVVAHFPVYRTYVTGDGAAEEDRRYIDWAVTRARRGAEAATDLSVYEFLRRALTGDLAADKAHGYKAAEVIRLAMKAQQFTGPVMAKAVEDTLFYRYVRLACLNEVGGDPDHFGTGVGLFHKANQERQRHWPHQLLATATHDHKRGADTRVRMAVISELAEDWGSHVRKWSRLNKLKKREMEQKPAPGRNDEYLLYQTLVGAWPLDLDKPEGPGLDAFADRLCAYMLKAVRESKYRSNWAAPDTDYEEALERFIRAILDPGRSAAFLEDLIGFIRRVEPVGAINGLSQQLLAATAPGVPDLYQGTDFWDLSLVDPDNRRPPDWAARQAALERPAAVEELLVQWRDGRIKQHVLHTALQHRARVPALYAEGEYVPVEASGPAAERVVAFLRRGGGAAALVVAPRLVAPLLPNHGQRPLVPAEAWHETVLHLPDLPDGVRLRNLLTGDAVPWPSEGRPGARSDGGRLAVADVLSRFPVALLATEETPAEAG
ncbi:malto-oligosyltrehalose synthase [Oleisolibacter albus]|uniref:malto-oligosyltrehalose synthase n=1 Tax=Oleisolibacter albus TaxID=2171757 RepID=UPI000DF42461|nr:malto-oligosyltrehalose synthase [Oleisolibacter albus]